MQPRTTRSVTEVHGLPGRAVPTCGHQRREIAPGGADTDYVAARPGVGGRAGGRGSLVGRRARAEPPGAGRCVCQSFARSAVCFQLL